MVYILISSGSILNSVSKNSYGTIGSLGNFYKDKLLKADAEFLLPALSFVSVLYVPAAISNGSSIFVILDIC